MNSNLLNQYYIGCTTTLFIICLEKTSVFKIYLLWKLC